MRKDDLIAKCPECRATIDLSQFGKEVIKKFLAEVEEKADEI